MPEGDSIAGDANQLTRVLAGREILGVYGTSKSVRSSSAKLLGATVTAVRAIGKNLLLDFDNGWSVWVHLGMTGRWRVGPRLDRPPGDSRLALTTATATAVCRKAPIVRVDRTPALEQRLEGLGPDVLADEFDTSEFVRRARLGEGQKSISEVLLDQQVIAGIGNVYKSEILYLEKVNPKRPVAECDDSVLVSIAERAVKVMGPNVGRSRSTTGGLEPGRPTWIYGRGGEACRRCGTRIASDEHGGRITYWCPGCQQS